jgi:hypothetical protein
VRQHVGLDLDGIERIGSRQTELTSALRAHANPGYCHSCPTRDEPEGGL